MDTRAAVWIHGAGRQGVRRVPGFPSWLRNQGQGSLWRPRSQEQVCVCAQRCPALGPRGVQPARLLCPWSFPGKSAGVGCHFLLQRTFPTQGWNRCLQHPLHWQAGSSPEPRGEAGVGGALTMRDAGGRCLQRPWQPGRCGTDMGLWEARR